MKGTFSKSGVSTPDDASDRVVVAVDAGGSTTRSAAVGLDGTCLGVGLADGANPVSRGIDEAAGAVVASISGALSGNKGTDVVGVLLAAAGGSHRPEFVDTLVTRLAELDVLASVDMVADGLAAFHSHSHAQDGYILVAGTGAVAQRIRGGQTEKVADGLGWLLGDVGGGFWLGRQVVTAVLADIDGRAPATAMTPLLLQALGLDPGDATTDLATGRPAFLRSAELRLYAERPTLLARFAPLALQAADDTVAQSLLDEAAEALAVTLRAVLEPGLGEPVVVGGGLLAGGPVLRRRVAEVLHRMGHLVELSPVEDGLVGAAVMVLRAHGVDVDAAVFDRLASSVTAMRVAAAAQPQA